MSVIIKSSGISTPTNVTVNGVNQGQVPANFPVDVEVTDYNGDVQDVDATLTGTDLAIQTKWWTRPSGWLDMPTITAADNKFAGLYAVWEEDVDNNTITINVGAGKTIDWGDGTIITSVLGTNTHNYDYATISSAVLISSDGRNYKMVMVEVDLTSVVTMLLSQNTPRRNRVTGWLDILASGSDLQAVRVSDNTSGTGSFAFYLERMSILNMAASTTQTNEIANSLDRLRVLDYPILSSINNYTRIFNSSGDIRQSNGQPLSINNATFASGLSLVGNFSKITELGDIILPNATTTLQSFVSSSLKRVGNINLSLVNTLALFFQNTPIQSVGTITVGTNLTNITSVFNSCGLVNEIVFAGDMSGVTTTTNAFLRVFNCQRLILPNLTIGFDIRASQVTGTNLQDLFTSLGTASGVQTITLPSFTSGESTTIATGKGYTIAYA